MRYLTIDTTTRVTALALAEDGRLIGEGFLHTPQTHSERLIPMLNQLLTAAAWGLPELDFIGVVRGPGSFTGIRIGIATAQGLAQVLRLPLLGILSLDALAWAGFGRREEIIPILDARKNEWYTARYRWKEGMEHLEVLSLPRAISPELWIQELVSLARPLLFVGDAVTKYRDYLQEALGEQALLLPEYMSLPRGAYAAQAVWQKWQEIRSGETVKPYYIRFSEAEVNWERKHGG
ncbi:MAG: tRNA (adenosine(37)-N6)-threonylcarbamoyltransferase complex dimerization subunit type 1 TsaB [Desulfitobacteriaceae bacterium]